MKNFNSSKAFSLIELSIVILIIGILIAGITQSSRLVEQMRLASASSLTQSSPTPSINGLIAWWETTSAKSFNDSEASNDQPISTWYDINPTSVTKFNAPQINTNNKPSYSASAINSLPALKFDGNSDYFEIAYNSDLNPNTFSIFAVAKPTDLSNFGTIFSSRSDSPQNGYMLYAAPSGTSPSPANPAYQVWIGNGSSSWGDIDATSIIITPNKQNVISATYDGATLTLYNAGTIAGSKSRTIVPTKINGFRIGAGRNESTPTYFFNGYIGEIIIFNRALKNEERQSVEKYLGKKWGVKINN